MEKRHTIAEWMAIKGMSRGKVAYLCDVSEQTVTNWQKRPLSITMRNGLKLAQCLGVSINDISDFYLPKN